MHRTVVLNIVGLTPNLIGERTPMLSRWAAGGKTARIQAVTPAVTCTAQATYFTGAYPDTHGIVGNGWYFRDECEVRFWRQSNKLVQAPKIWDKARAMEPSFTCANLFGWYNMYSSVDCVVTPRPMYPADGRKLPDIYTVPGELRTELQGRLGQFPLFHFWGPGADIRSTEWIAEAAIYVDANREPTLTLVYLPHLDYDLQRFGPADPLIARALGEIDSVFERLRAHYEGRGARVVVISEYGITPVTAPVHINRVLREAGLIAVREELGRELLDAGASAAFAVADHQVAHVYVNDASRIDQVKDLLERTPGIECVLGEEGKRAARLQHTRSGELVAIARPDSWFTYYYWLDDRRAPDFARTVDIHRKPGYDPVELFLDPDIHLPQLRIAMKLGRKLMGFRYLMDVIPLDATLVKGSHGRPGGDPGGGPLLITRQASLVSTPALDAGSVGQTILRHLFD